MGSVRIGMSGFSYPSWIGTFYPPGTKRSELLSRYAESLDTVELNVTFRRSPEPDTLQRWRDAVPEGFRFAVKAHMRITHTRRLQDHDALRDFVERIRILGDRLGPLLVQTPPNLAFERPVVEAFLHAIPDDIACALEARHPSFATDEAEELLAEHRVARCINDEERDPVSYRITGRVAYLRLRRDTYDAASLDALAGTLTALGQETDVYAFVKHEDRPGATEPALELRSRIVR